MFSTEPVFSLDDGKYSEVQEVTLSASGEAIYYTTDGTNPTSSSTKYTEPILLNEEGKTQIKAIAITKRKSQVWWSQKLMRLNFR